jgi:hypothetical protein
MRHKTVIALAISLITGWSLKVTADTISLGTAGNYAVLADMSVSNTGNTVIDGGDVGVSPGTSITGFSPPGTITPPYTIDNADAATAETDLTTAYNAAAGLTGATDLTGMNLGTLTLTPGVYSFSAAADLTGTLILNDEGNPNAQFVFQIGTALTTAAGSSVVTTNDGTSTTPGSTVFWQIGSSATLGADNAFEGHILADQNITIGADSTILNGSALALNATVTLNDDDITNSIASSTTTPPASVPLPSVLLSGLVMVGLLAVGAAFKRVKSLRVAVTD